MRRKAQPAVLPAGQRQHDGFSAAAGINAAPLILVANSAAQLRLGAGVGHSGGVVRVGLAANVGDTDAIATMAAKAAPFFIDPVSMVPSPFNRPTGVSC